MSSANAHTVLAVARGRATAGSYSITVRLHAGTGQRAAVPNGGWITSAAAKAIEGEEST